MTRTPSLCQPQSGVAGLPDRDARLPAPLRQKPQGANRRTAPGGETLADRRVELGPRYEVGLGPLVHPVHAAGSVFGWRIGAPRAPL